MDPADDDAIATLRAVEDRLRRTQELGRIGDWEFDVDSRTIRWSPEVFRLFDRDPALGPPSYEEKLRSYEPEDRARLEEHVRRAMADGERVEDDYRVRLPSGRVVHHRATIVPVRDASARIVRLVGTVQDVTTRHEAARDLDDFFRISTDLLCIADTNGYFRRVNPAFERVLGWSAETLTTKPYLDFVHPEDVPSTSEAKQSVSIGKTVANFENRYRCRDGSYRWLSWSTAGVTESGLLCAVARDVTEAKRIEAEKALLAERLQRSQRMEALGTLAGGVAHDFNNLLTVILGSTDLLLHGDAAAADGTETRAHLEEIRNAAERAASLTRQLLALGQGAVPHAKVVDPRGVVLAMEPLLRRLAGERIELRRRVTPGSARVRGETSHLEQIVLNLVGNAVDALPRGGSIEVGVDETDLGEAHCRTHPGARAGRHVVVSVRDDGVGIAPDVMEHIFEPIYTTKPVGRGTGLGLATVFGVTQQLGGHIAVESTLGKGSLFRVFLPATVESAVESDVPAEAPPLEQGAVALVCEDEPSVRSLIASVLERAGMRVLSAGSGAEALRLARGRREPIDLLVTDVIMPERNGREVAEAVAKIHPETRVLFVSGYAADILDEAGVDSRGVGFLQKPFLPRALVQRVREILATPKG